MVSKAAQRKEIKLEMLRFCQTWKFNEELTISYFKQRGYSLSHTHYYELKGELEADKTTIEWFNDMALKTMEKHHKEDYETLEQMQDTLVQEIYQLNLTNPYMKNPENEEELILNPEHDSALIAKLIDSVEKLTKAKGDMMAATPMVQAMMVKKREDEEKQRIQEAAIIESK